MTRLLVRHATSLHWCAGLLFAVGMLTAFATGSRWGVLAMAVGAILHTIVARVRERTRIDSAYALMARIGEGEFAAREEPSRDELTLRLHRGVARVQRGFAQALASAESERDEFRSLLGAVDTGLLALDPQLRIRSANQVAERLLDLPIEGYRSKILGEVVRQSEFLAFMEKARASTTATTAELPLSGGKTERILVAADPVRTPAGQLVGLFVALDDLTRVRRLEQLRTDFAANVSHELRTPITNIKGYLDALREVGFDDPALATRFIEIIQRNTNRLCALIEDTLLLAFLERPGAERQVAIALVRVEDVVRDALEQASPAAAAKSMRIETSIDTALRVHADQSLLTQALLNLLSNAVKYAPEGTPITVSGNLEGQMLVLTVADRGPGIDAIHIPRLFERFYRVDSARSRDMGGTGLGLSIVKHIARLHGGTASVECPPSGGSRFFLSISSGLQEPHTS